jgi:hypothetical protein
MKNAPKLAVSMINMYGPSTSATYGGTSSNSIVHAVDSTTARATIRALICTRSSSRAAAVSLASGAGRSSRASRGTGFMVCPGGRR